MMFISTRSVVLRLVFGLFVCGVVRSEPFDPAVAREIFPIPRHAKYQSTVIPLPNVISLQADGSFDPEKIRMMAEDAGKYITRRYGKEYKVKVEDPKTSDVKFRIVIFREKNVPADLAGKLFVGPFVPGKFPAGVRGGQSFIIRSLLADKEPAVYIVCRSEQGAWYALFAVVQLIRYENTGGTLRGADVIDWPAFEARATSDVNGLSAKMPVETQHAFILRKAAIQRITHGFYGYGQYTSEHKYAYQRGLRLGMGYWERPKLAAPLQSWNWSASESIKGYADLAGQLSAPPMSLYVWHDGTDAGWWFEYLDNFWAKRDAVDKKNYPNDPTPARADAVRFDAMLKAIRQSNPDAHIFLTPPCYYDSPENDKLPRVELLREYLKVVGKSVPADMKDRVYFILEERSPESAAAYGKYLNAKMCNYRYTPLWNGGTWDTNYTEAKRHDGRTAAYYYDLAFLQYDLLNLLSSQYMWNPDLPTDEQWIVDQLASRAAYLAYGPAWKPLVLYWHLNLNGNQAGRESDLGNLRKLRDRIALADRWIKQAETLVPTTWTDAKAVVEVNRGYFTDIKKAADKSWEEARKFIPLDHAKFSADSTSSGDIKAAALGKGRWISAKTPLPHWVEVELPRPYRISRLLIDLPGDNGYSLPDVEIQAMVLDTWRKVGQTGKAEQRPLVCEFDDLRTDRLKLIVHQVWDWSKQPRNDVQITGIKVFGQPLPKDPPGLLRLDGKWRFRLDPEKQGVKKAWFKPGELSSDWQSMVVPLRWEESGQPGTVDFDGWAWYTRTFELPASWKGRVIKLQFQAVDDEAEVWVNGRRVGEHHKEGETDPDWWEEPFEFDITSCLDWSGRNTVTVLVNDFTLDGGIWKSVILRWSDGPGAIGPKK